MTKKIMIAFFAGILGMISMTVVLFIASLVGFPVQNPGEILSLVMGIAPVVGWMVHFMIGIIFCALYIFLLNRYFNKISNRILRGVLFGIFVFICTLIAMNILARISSTPEAEIRIIDNVISLLAYIAYGVTIVLSIKKDSEIHQVYQKEPRQV